MSTRNTKNKTGSMTTGVPWSGHRGLVAVRDYSAVCVRLLRREAQCSRKCRTLSGTSWIVPSLLYSQKDHKGKQH